MNKRFIPVRLDAKNFCYVMMRACQGCNTFGTKAESDRWIDAVIANNRPGELENLYGPVRLMHSIEVECYEGHNDPKGSIFPIDDAGMEYLIATLAPVALKAFREFLSVTQKMSQRITLTDKDFGKLTFDPIQIHNIEFHLPDRLGIGVNVKGIPGHEQGLLIVPVDPEEIRKMFQILGA